MEDEEAGKAAEAAAGGGEGGEKRGHKVGGLSRTVRARGWGLTTTTPQRRGFLFVPREFLFVSFPVARPDPTHPPTHPNPIPSRRQRASIPPLAFAIPPPPASSALSSSVRFLLPPPPLSTSLPITVHLKYEFDITFHPTALARPPPRTSSSVLSLAVSSSPSSEAIRPLLVPAQFNCWHFIKSIDSAPSCLRLCKLMPRPTGRELFLASAFVGIGIAREGVGGHRGREGGRARGKKEGSREGWSEEKVDKKS